MRDPCCVKPVRLPWMLLAAVLGLIVLTVAACRKPTTWTDLAHHKNGFVTANGIRLHYLDWGGTGPVLVLIHGYSDNAHVFDDLAPAFTDRFHVIAYDRRAHGASEAKAPYDVATLTEDLRGLMDGLGVAKVSLAGWSMGGDEITAMAGTHPERVDRIVYLESAYDWADPLIVAGFGDLPVDMNPPTGAKASLDAWREYQRTVWLAGVPDTNRFEAYIRDLVDIQSDGTVRPRMSDNVAQLLWTTLTTDRRDYTRVRAPALAIYAETFFDVRNGDSAQRAKNLAWEQKHMAPFRSASTERVRRELPGVEIVNVPGTHMGFVFTSREQVVSAIRRFLGGSASQG
jgi:pimeloyl-ACP methyl ester carboxylesterase